MITIEQKMENQDISIEASKRKFDIQEEKSLDYLGRTLLVDRESMTVFLPYDIMENLNRRHRSCINYLKQNRGYSIQLDIK